MPVRRPMTNGISHATHSTERLSRRAQRVGINWTLHQGSPKTGCGEEDFCKSSRKTAIKKGRGGKTSNRFPSSMLPHETCVGEWVRVSPALATADAVVVVVVAYQHAKKRVRGRWGGEGEKKVLHPLETADLIVQGGERGPPPPS